MATIGVRVCALALAGFSCGGGNGNGKTGPALDAAILPPATDGGASDAARAEASVDLAPDVSPDLPPLPPAEVRRLLPGKARLAGADSACSHGGAPETWCAFVLTLDGATDAGPGPTQLWVINASRAAAGETFPCDGTSPHCRRLHDNLWTGGSLGGPIFPYDDRFDGDTLMFYPGGPATKTDGIYEGPVFAWRPGWAEPRLISSDKGLFCFGHPRAAVAYCVENVTPGPPVQFDLRAGTLADAPGVALPVIATGVRPWRGNEIAWHAEWSPDATQFAISVQEPSTEGEVLHVGATAELGKKALREVAYDATYWRISLDGKKIYYLQNFAGVPTPTGKLVMADFPSGANPVVLQTAVARFFLLGESGAVDRGVGLFQDIKDGVGSFKVIANRDQPAQITTVVTEVEDVYPSPDGRFVLFARADDQGVERLNLARTDGKGTCVLNPTGPDVFGVHFLAGAELVFWSAFDDANAVEPTAEGWVARTDGCADRRRYAERADYVTTIKDRIALVAHSPKDDGRYTLLHAAVDPAKHAVSSPRLIQADTDGLVVPFFDARSARLLFEVPDGPADLQGIYVFGPLPL